MGVRQSARVPSGLRQAPRELTRIVIADDDRFFVEMVRAALEDSGQFKVVGTASTGEEAIQRVEELQPSLVLMDVDMPVLDGVQATDRLRKLADPPTVVLITGEDIEAHSAIYRAGAACYVNKDHSLPLLIGVLLAAVMGETSELARC